MFLSTISEVTTYTKLAVAQNKDYDLSSGSHPVYGCSIQAVYTNATPIAVVVPSVAITFATCLFTLVGHGLVTGVKGQFTTDDTLPTGISAVTDYWIIKLTDNTFKVADSLVHALAGVAITLTDAGLGNQTFTPTALAGIIVKLQMSNDGSNFTDITGKTVTIGAAGSILWDLGVVTYKILRVTETPSSGAINLTLNFNVVNIR